MKMRVWAVVCLLVLTSTSASAQISFNWNEWFRQRRTEKRYLQNHIVNLQIYLQLLKQGYRAVEQGTKIIHQVKRGEFGLHDLFYLSLKIVNNRIRNYPAVTKTIDYHSYIADKSQELLRRSRESEYLWPEEKEYVVTTMDRLRTDMAASLDELVTVLSDGELELSDDERLAAIDRLETYAQQRMIFIKSYFAHVLAMAAQRMGEAAELSTLQNRHGLQ